MTKEEAKAAGLPHWWSYGNKSGAISGKMNTGKMRQGILATKHPTTLDIAWAAGIWEGEGSCWYNGTMLINQKDRELCDRFQALFGGKVYQTHHKHSSFGPQSIWNWRVYGARGRGVAMTIYGFLTQRRKDQIKKVFQSPPEKVVNHLEV